MNITSKLLLPVTALVFSTALVTAQEQNNPPPRPDGDRGGERRDGDRRGFSMEDFRKRMEERLKGALKVSDEEWAVLQPLIEKVQTKQREAMGARFGGFAGGPGGPPGGFPGFGDRRRGPDGGGGAPDSGGERRRGPDGGGDRGPGGPGGAGGDRGPGGPGGERGGSPESQALRATLENENATPEEIKAKLAAVRDVRKKSASELEAARAELQKVVTVRQEAVLVAMGLLE